MKNSDIDEAVVSLYLRLNGYFSTGLVVHSDKHGEVRTEIDCLAIRLPFHSESERQVNAAPFLSIRRYETDLIVCEVKGFRDNINFNEALKKDVQSIEYILRWAGVFEPDRVKGIAERVHPLLMDDVGLEEAQEGIIEDGVRVRALLCCAKESIGVKSRWCLTGGEIFRYADECFSPSRPRSTCSVRYNFSGNWSYPLNHIVGYLKSEKRNHPARIEDLYAYFGCQNTL